LADEAFHVIDDVVDSLFVVEFVEGGSGNSEAPKLLWLVFKFPKRSATDDGLTSIVSLEGAKELPTIASLVEELVLLVDGCAISCKDVGKSSIVGETLFPITAGLL